MQNERTTLVSVAFASCQGIPSPAGVGAGSVDVVALVSEVETFRQAVPEVGSRGGETLEGGQVANGVL